MNPNGRMLEFISWTVGIFFFALVIIGIVSISSVLLSFLPKSNIAGLQFHNLLFNLPVSVLLITYLTVALGFIFRKLLRRFENKSTDT